MSGLGRASKRRPVRSRPWTIAGGRAPDYSDDARLRHHAHLTDPQLGAPWPRRWRAQLPGGYDAAVRRLGDVWDCPDDGTASVTGYRCASCGHTRAEAAGTRAQDAKP